MKTIKDYWKNFWAVFWQPDMLILPGQLAFFFFLSVVPIITLISYGASYLHLSIDFISNFLIKAFGHDIANLVIPIVSNQNLSTGYLITLFVGYFIASNGAASIIVASNKIYGIKDSGFIKRRIKAIIMTLFIVLLFLFMLTVPLFGDKIIDLVEYVNLNARITERIVLVFKVLKGPVSWFIIFLFIKILFTMAPDRKIPSSYVNYGAIFTSISWVLVTTIYSYYINNFARYDVFYGGLANIVILMLWVYLLAYIFVIGIGLNYHKEEIILEKTGIIDVKKKQKI